MIIRINKEKQALKQYVKMHINVLKSIAITTVVAVFVTVTGNALLPLLLSQQAAPSIIQTIKQGNDITQPAP